MQQYVLDKLLLAVVIETRLEEVKITWWLVKLRLDEEVEAEMDLKS